MPQRMSRNSRRMSRKSGRGSRKSRNRKSQSNRKSYRKSQSKSKRQKLIALLKERKKIILATVTLAIILAAGTKVALLSPKERRKSGSVAKKNSENVLTKNRTEDKIVNASTLNNAVSEKLPSGDNRKIDKNAVKGAVDHYRKSFNQNEQDIAKAKQQSKKAKWNAIKWCGVSVMGCATMYQVGRPLGRVIDETVNNPAGFVKFAGATALTPAVGRAGWRVAGWIPDNLGGVVPDNLGGVVPDNLGGVVPDAAAAGFVPDAAAVPDAAVDASNLNSLTALTSYIPSAINWGNVFALRHMTNEKFGSMWVMQSD